MACFTRIRESELGNIVENWRRDETMGKTSSVSRRNERRLWAGRQGDTCRKTLDRSPMRSQLMNWCCSASRCLSQPVASGAVLRRRGAAAACPLAWHPMCSRSSVAPRPAGWTLRTPRAGCPLSRAPLSASGPALALCAAGLLSQTQAVVFFLARSHRSRAMRIAKSRALLRQVTRVVLQQQFPRCAPLLHDAWTHERMSAFGVSATVDTALATNWRINFECPFCVELWTTLTGHFVEKSNAKTIFI